MPRLLLILSVLVSTLALAGADVFAELKMSRDDWQESFAWALKMGAGAPPTLSGAARAIPAGQRAAVVKALGDAAKAFYGSAAFRTRYADLRKGLPSKPRKLSADEIIAEHRAKDSAPIAMMAVAGGTKAEIAELTRAVEQGLPTRAAAEKEAAQRFASDQEDYRSELSTASVDTNMPTDPKVALKAALENFLESTAEVDHAAKTAPRGSFLRFANEAYQEKPGEWKLCFRAGKEACEAARAFAKSWLGELK